MKSARILQNALVCTSLALTFGCANRSTYNPYQQYPPYPQQYGQQPMQAYPYTGQPGQIQPSPMVGTPPAGGLVPGYAAPGVQPTGYMQPVQPMQQYYGPPQGQGPAPFLGR